VLPFSSYTSMGTPLEFRQVEHLPTAYRDQMTTPRAEDGPTGPRNQDFVESIAESQLAALEALWTEPETPFPKRTR
jgi:hypothetical protein